MKLHSITRLLKAAFVLCTLGLTASLSHADGKDTLNATDVTFVKHEAAAGKAIFKVAELGVKKAGHADVKKLAETVVLDHTKLNAEMKTLAAAKGVDLSEIIDPEAAEVFQKLEGTTSIDFDKELLKALVKAHKKCIKKFEASSTEASDADVKSWAVATLPTLNRHLTAATALLDK